MGQSKSSTMVSRILRHPRFRAVVWWNFLLLSFIMVIHNLVFLSWGIGTFDSITRMVERRGEEGFFDSTPLYDAEGKPSFLQYARSPAGRFMHILPAGLWSVIAPLQLSPTFRARHPTAHRRLGRLFMFMSASIAFGLAPLILSGATKEVRKLAVLDASPLAIMVYFLAAGLLAVHHARNKRFAEHRVWMLRHVAMGYSVHMQRLFGYLTWWALPLFLPSTYTELSQEGSQLRADVFSSYFIAGAFVTVGSMEVWLRHTSPTGQVLRDEVDHVNGGKTASAKAA
eukprot:g10016.t1